MDSSSREYIHTLENIKEELVRFKSEQNKLRLQISRFFEENRRLTVELKENVEMRFLHASESDVGHLEEALQAALDAKNAAIERWQLALQELEKQEELLVGKKSIIATARGENEKQFLQMKEEYAKGLNLLSEELSNSRQEHSRLKKELDVKNTEIKKYKTDISLVCEELEENKKTISELSIRNNQLMEKNISSQSSMTELEKALSICKEELTTCTARNVELLASVAKLEDQNKKLKSEILVWEKEANESLQAAEQAVFEKKEIMYKEKQYQEEIKMLKSSIELEKEKVAIRFRAEMKEVQEKSTEKIEKLMSDINILHKEIGEKQNLFERANREKQALESKAELLFSENSSGVPVSNSTFEDMGKRLTMTERARDELELKVSSLETTLQELRFSKEQEIHYLVDRQNNLNERLKSLSKDFNQVSSDKIKLSNEMTKLKKKASGQEKELVLMREKYTRDISTLEENSHRKILNLQEQLRSSVEHYKNVCSELQKLLETEFKISKEWKSEVENLISQSEITIKELIQEKEQLKNNHTDLINILHQNNVRIPNEILVSLI